MVMFEDVSGRPRPRADIEAALKCITSEVVKNPLAMSTSGEPLAIHYMVIRDALQELLALRELVERARAAAKERT